MLCNIQNSCIERESVRMRVRARIEAKGPTKYKDSRFDPQVAGHRLMSAVVPSPRWHAEHHGSIGHIPGNNGAGADRYIITDQNIWQNARTEAHECPRTNSNPTAEYDSRSEESERAKFAIVLHNGTGVYDRASADSAPRIDDHSSSDEATRLQHRALGNHRAGVDDGASGNVVKIGKGIDLQSEGDRQSNGHVNGICFRRYERTDLVVGAKHLDLIERTRSNGQSGVCRAGYRPPGESCCLSDDPRMSPCAEQYEPHCFLKTKAVEAGARLGPDRHRVKVRSRSKTVPICITVPPCCSLSVRRGRKGLKS